ncbi:hypothetical protein O1Q96_29220 [Streptomyces sp. Qhu-G9]|uniref:hypothetical protein n=1 Tax=Streptomyces sp. Qhu-G9 TaxID=3452799 RepID=UPI0022AC27AC|nr:hypothetical protein [Streptomyces aurantiacus]WAU83412.1 hypothetical protein O1Q96_29220 [Streptomyces aurantiacus]
MSSGGRDRAVPFGKRVAAGFGAVGLAAVALLGASGPAHADGHGPGNYGVWASGVNVRDGGEWCQLYPSPTECTRIVATVSAPSQVYVYCQQAGGQTVGGNPYWVWVIAPNGVRGWMAGYYIKNNSNWIDGVPDCRA